MAREVIVRRFASTLVSISRDVAQLEDWLHQLETFSLIIRRMPRLSRFIANPAIPEPVKQDLFQRALKDQFDPRIQRFVQLLLILRRLGLVHRIVEELRFEIDRLKGHHYAEITSAIPLPDSMRRKVVASLEKVSGYRLDPEFVVDPSIIGGLHIHIDDVAIDARYSRRLAELRDRLTEHSLLFRPSERSHAQ